MRTVAKDPQNLLGKKMAQNLEHTAGMKKKMMIVRLEKPGRKNRIKICRERMIGSYRDEVWSKQDSFPRFKHFSKVWVILPV